MKIKTMLRSKPFYALAILIGMTAIVMSCGGQNSSLGLTVVPTQPVLVPFGTTTDCAGNSITAPFFKIDQLQLSWSGSDTVDIQAIIITLREAGSASNQICAVGGTGLSAIFTASGTPAPSATPIPATEITISPPTPGGTPSMKSTSCPIICSVTVADQFATSFNISGTLRVMASTINSSSQTTGRTTATATITIR